MKWLLSRYRLVVICLITAFSGMVPLTALSAPDSADIALVTIQGIRFQGVEADPQLLVSTSAMPTYTSYRASSPTRLVVDFSQAAPVDGLSGADLVKGAVKGVTVRRFDTDAGVLTRMELYLTQDIEPVITPVADNKSGLVISFPGYRPDPLQPATAVGETTQAEPQAAQALSEKEGPKLEPETAVAATAVTISGENAVTAITAVKGVVLIRTNAPVPDYKTFRLNKPERVVLDLPNVRSNLAERLVQLNSSAVSTARVGGYPDKVRIVFDPLGTSLPDAIIKVVPEGLLVSFGDTEPTARMAAKHAAVQIRSEGTEAAVVAQPVVTRAAPAAAVKTVTDSKGAVAPFKQVNAVDFQALQGVSRVTVKTSGNPLVEQPVKSAGMISFKVKGALLPLSLQRSFETAAFDTPVLRITPVQVRSKSGADVLIRVAMREDTQFELKQESDLILLDINHPSAEKKQAATAGAQKGTAAAVATQSVIQQEKPVKEVAEAQPVSRQEEPGGGETIAKRYTGRKVTLEFADAEVRKIFQLLSEVSNKNFVLGDEVTGTISLKLVNVPWDQALDIILDTKGLDRREEGNIILIRGKGKFKSILDEEVEIRKAALKGEPLVTEMFDVNYAELPSIVTQFTALKTDRGMISQDTRTNKIIVKDVREAIEDMRKILASLDVPEKQVMIEARIVEASSSFTQSLGVNWGIHYRDGSASIAGINAFDTSFGGLTSQAPPTSGVSGTSGATAGISFGTLSSNIKLDMRLNAAVAAGMVRIVSTPKVATLNHKSAKITQGQQIPYTSATSDKTETKFVEAALALEVTPHINPNGTIVMKIDAKNDSPGSTGSGTEAPPINKKQATTEMMLRDGETTVIGGIYVENETNDDEGVPYLQDVPLLGKLFKSNKVTRTRNELLIFITPRIIHNINN